MSGHETSLQGEARRNALEESVDPAHETFNRVFRKAPEKLP